MTNNMITKATKMSFTAKKKLAAVLASVLVAMSGMSTMVGFAAGEVNLDKVTDPVIGLVPSITNYLIPLVAVVGALFCISLGVKFAKAEEPQEREKAKQHLKNAIIGFVLIFVLIVALRGLTPTMVKWMNDNSTPTTASVMGTTTAAK